MAETTPSNAASEQTNDANVEQNMNLALLDPPRFGWSATGGVVDVLPPQDRARRLSTRNAHVKLRRDRERRKERTEARKQKESTSKNSSNQQFVATDRMHSVLPPFMLKDPPLSNSGNTDDAQQKIPAAVPTSVQGLAMAAPAADGARTMTATPAAMNSDGCAQQNESNGATEGTAETIVGSVSLPMNKKADGAAAATGAETAPVAQQPSQKFDGSATLEPILATINESNNTAEALSLATATAALGENAETSMLAAAAVDSAMQAAVTLGDNPNPPSAATRSDDNKKSPSDGVVKVNALNQDGVLDMYTYHRGREGMEPRDDESGQLLCDVEPTETNHGWEPPSMKLSISISFPIGDSDEMADGEGNEESKGNENTRQTRRQSQGQEQNSGVQYSETIEWDLADPKTMTPMCFATRVSEEFGLDSDQTFALAESIQKQINYFVQSRVSYKSPLTLLDANGNERSGASVHSPNMRGPPQLYGSVIGETRPGMPIPQKLVQTTKTPRSSGTSSLDPISVYGPSLPLKDIDPLYRDEVLRRAIDASRKGIAEKWPNGVVGAMETDEDGVCHACRKSKKTWSLPCGNNYHALCSKHIASVFGVFVEDGDDPIVDYCPICALKCDCKSCSKKLATACNNLQSKCIEEGVSPDMVPLDEIIRPRASSSAPRNSQKARERRPSNKIDLNLGTRVTVPKVPASDFPREVCGGYDMDPGTRDDYRTVYTADGAFLRTDVALPGEDTKLPAAVPLSSNGIQEDGNVDYCHTCKKAGNLMCCDFCPRAFHPNCISSDEPTNGEEAWECVVCREERETSDDDVVTGQSSLGAVCATFVDFKHSDRIDTCAHALSIIHETISKLIDYDFGVLFSSPVDCEAIPGYRTVVKNPMDLGTISSRIIDGEYVKKYQENQSWDDVLVAVLQDIELVWHNCFTFNCEGSSVYRMAEVQRRKYQKIRKRSFDNLLTFETKQRVEAYVSERMKTRARAQTNKSDRRHNGRNKITVGNTKRHYRVVAILDPETGLLVKMYSTFKGASLAAQFLLGLGHAIEFTTLKLSDVSLKKIVQASSKDPAVLLFGYRWLYMDDLLSRKVKFDSSDDGRLDYGGLDAAPPCTLEVKVGSESYVFLSVEEAVSWSGLPDNVPTAEMRQKLSEIPFDEWTTICGLSWRKLEQAGQKPASLSTENGGSSLRNQCPIVDVSKYPFPTNVGFVKEDLVTRRALAGFESAAAAHADWLETRQNSPVDPADEPADLEYFELYYLDGERNIDGIIWRSNSSTAHPIDSGTSSNAFPLNVANSSDEGTNSGPKTTTALEASVESVSPSTNAGSGRSPTNDSATESAGLPTALEGYALDAQPVKGLFSPLRSATKTNGELLGAKRAHECDGLGSGRASKKAAVCYS